MRHLLPPDVLYFTTEMPCGCDPRRCVSPPQNRAKNNGIMRWGFRVFNLHLSNPLGQSGSSLFVVGDDISLSLLLQVLCVVGVGLKPHDPLGKKKFRPKTLLLEEIFFVRTPYKMQSSRQFNNDRPKSTNKKSIDQPISVGDELVWNRLNCRPVMNRLGPTLPLISRGMNIFMSLFYRSACKLKSRWLDLHIHLHRKFLHSNLALSLWFFFCSKRTIMRWPSSLARFESPAAHWWKVHCSDFSAIDAAAAAFVGPLLQQ